MPLVPRNLKPRFGCGKNHAVIPRAEKPRAIILRCLGKIFGSLLQLGTARSEPQFSPGHRGARSASCAVAWALGFAFAFTASAAGVRLRDLVMVAGARDNQLVGYGLVAGLAGEGDKDPAYTKQTVANMLLRFGINLPAATLSAKNVAVVMVTADIPAFVKPGARIDVNVASMGDAKTLQGGALVEREIPSSVVHDKTVELLLREPSFTVASRMAAAINNVFTNSAHAQDTTSVD